MQRRTLLLTGMAAGLAAPGHAAPKPVVLELFTSQGCSSCPPADALLGEQARQPGVIALAWHVDYWNRLGWRDPYASRDWTARQHAYAAALREEVYTPALVIDGTVMVVGSDRPAVRQAIRNASGLTTMVSLVRTPDALTARIDPLPPGASLLMVSYTPRAATSVGAGENGGRRLQEYRIVRSARMIDAAAGLIALPPIADDQGVVLLVQDSDLRIRGAADAPAVTSPRESS
jgi:hypothetical protein